MDTAAAAFPDDDIVTLDAEAAMDMRPWGYWSDDGKPNPGTLDIIRKLEGVLAHDPAHFGAEQLLMHALRRVADPGARARRRARRRRGSVRAGGRTPRRTCPRTSSCASASTTPRARATAGRSTCSRRTSPFRTRPATTVLGPRLPLRRRRVHDGGRTREALAIAARCHNAANRYTGDVYLRFRAWPELAPYLGTSQFLLGMFAASKGDGSAALAAATQLDAQKDDVSKLAPMWCGRHCIGSAKRASAEIASLEKAVREQDKLGYSEPPHFFYPVRESLGGAYFRAGRFADAEAVFRADLVRNPRNPRSLFGLANALRAQGRAADAAAADRDFGQAWAHADVTLTMDDL